MNSVSCSTEIEIEGADVHNDFDEGIYIYVDVDFDVREGPEVVITSDITWDDVEIYDFDNGFDETLSPDSVDFTLKDVEYQLEWEADARPEPFLEESKAVLDTMIVEYGYLP